MVRRSHAWPPNDTGLSPTLTVHLRELTYTQIKIHVITLLEKGLWGPGEVEEVALGVNEFLNGGKEAKEEGHDAARGKVTLYTFTM